MPNLGEHIIQKKPGKLYGQHFVYIYETQKT